MKTSKALLDFVRDTDSNVWAYANAAVESLEKNPDFPTLLAEVSALRAENAGYAVGLSASKSGLRSAIAAKNAKKTIVINRLKAVTAGVNSVARGNVEMLSTTSLKLSAASVPKVLTAPVLTVKDVSVPGSITLLVGEAKYAKSYNLALSSDRMGKVIVATQGSNERKITVANLESGNVYYIRVQAIAPRKQSIWSSIISVSVQ